MDLSAHFGLQCDPFSLTPDARFYYEAPTHRDALNGLKYAANARVPCSVLLGPTGAGKSLLMSILRDYARNRRPVAWADGLQCGPTGLMVHRAGADERGGESLIPLNELDPGNEPAQRPTLLILDNADEVPVPQLRRLVSHLEPSSPCPLDLVLAGTSTLAAALQDPALARLQQRIARAFTLAHLTRSETAGYLAHRLRTAAAQENLFEAEALLRIHLLCEGLPGRINQLAGNALLAAAQAGAKKVNAAHIDAARGWQIPAITGVTRVNKPVLRPSAAGPSTVADTTPTPDHETATLAQLEQKLARALAAVRAARTQAAGPVWTPKRPGLAGKGQGPIVLGQPAGLETPCRTVIDPAAT